MKIRNARIVYDVVKSTVPELSATDTRAYVNYMRGAFDQWPLQEQIWVILLDIQGHILGRNMVALGSDGSVHATASEIYRPAIVAGARSIVIVHTHPAGDPKPSDNDKGFTRALIMASLALDVNLIDHIIIGDAASDPLGNGYVSMRDSGMLDEIVLDAMKFINKNSNRVIENARTLPILRELERIINMRELIKPHELARELDKPALKPAA